MNALIKTIVILLVAVGIPLMAKAASPEDVAQVVKMMHGRQMVFVHHGLRYTFWYPADLPGKKGWLSVWVRRNGTSGQTALDTFTDHGYNGVVDFGIDGKKTKNFDTGVDTDSKPEGMKYRPFWQKQYDAAIKAALAHKRSHER